MNEFLTEIERVGEMNPHLLETDGLREAGEEIALLEREAQDSQSVKKQKRGGSYPPSS